MTMFQELEAKFGDKVEVTGEGTPETTGYLEVILMDTGNDDGDHGDTGADDDSNHGDGDNCGRNLRNDSRRFNFCQCTLTLPPVLTKDKNQLDCTLPAQVEIVGGAVLHSKKGGDG